MSAVDYEELASKVMNSLTLFSKNRGVEVSALMGALNVEHIARLRGAIYATPSPVAGKVVPEWVAVAITKLADLGATSRKDAVSMELNSPHYYSNNHRNELVGTGLISSAATTRGRRYYVNSAGRGWVDERRRTQPTKVEAIAAAELVSVSAYIKMAKPHLEGYGSAIKALTAVARRMCIELGLTYEKAGPYVPGKTRASNLYPIEALRLAVDFIIERDRVNAIAWQARRERQNLKSQSAPNIVTENLGVGETTLDAVDAFFNQGKS